VVRNPNVTELRRICKERGMMSLREDGLQKVASGQTTVEEVLSATESTT
jgi:type II secretory ATPase GspE/PulE/Tfp pilus assembly ATPase PilB-like protein